MFGIGKINRNWSWYAYGKHPVVRDYLSVGKSSPVFASLSRWVDSGFRSLTESADSDSTISWRFFSTGAGKDLICGIIKSSFDSMKRNFPLVIIGYGKLEKWDQYWEYMPFSCEKIWLDAERIASKPFENLKQFKKEVKILSCPDINYANFEIQRNKLKEMEMFSSGNGFCSEYRNKLNNIEGLSRKEIFSVDFGSCGADSLNSFYSLVNLLHLLKKRNPKTPNTVFWGGSQTSSQALILKRPLRSGDFKILWSEIERDND